MQTKRKQLDFPFGGVETSRPPRENTLVWGRGYHTTESALNVWATCPFEGRMRGGSRAGTMSIGAAETTTWEWFKAGPLEWSDGTAIELLTMAERLGDDTILLREDVPEEIVCTKGTAPEAPTITARYRFRTVAVEGNVWYMSRQGVKDDWDYSGDGAEVGQAVAGTLALPGQAPEPITAVVPVADELCYFATANALWVLQGDPTNGRVTLISDKVGIVSQSAWARDTHTVFFLSNDGVYLLRGNDLTRWSENKIPNSLKNIDISIYKPRAGYDAELDGYFLFFEGGDIHYFFTVARQAVWPFTMPETQVPRGICTIRRAPRLPRMGFIGSDDVWRVFDYAAEDDDGDGNPIHSSVRIGPFQVGNDFTDGVLAELYCTFTDLSDRVKVSVHVGHDCEECNHNADSKPAAMTFESGGGWNRVVRPRVRGAWCCLTLEADKPWAYENIAALERTTGRLR